MFCSVGAGAAAGCCCQSAVSAGKALPTNAFCYLESMLAYFSCLFIRVGVRVKAGVRSGCSFFLAAAFLQVLASAFFCEMSMCISIAQARTKRSKIACT